jgi:hypothetical protein
MLRVDFATATIVMSVVRSGKRRVITEGKATGACLAVHHGPLMSGSAPISSSLVELSICSRDEIFWQRLLSEPQ